MIKTRLRRGLLALCCTGIATAVVVPAAVAAPTFYATNEAGELVTVEKVKKVKEKKNGKKKVTKSWRATSAIPLQFTPDAGGLVGLDQRPVNGELNAIGDNNVVYRINPATGIATGVAGTATAPFLTTLEGNLFGVDFNPTVPGGGAIRIVSDTNYNHRVSPNTGSDGAGTPDADLNGGLDVPKIVHAAYTNSALSITQPMTTQLFVLDSANDRLYEQNPPNAGTLTNPNDVSFDVTDVGGFDILGNGTTGYVVSKFGGRSILYRLDITTGQGTELGKVKRTPALTGLAVVQR
jgi:hypothetical protein